LERKKKSGQSLSDQIKAHSEKEPEKNKDYDGNNCFVSTGSTQLDLAISGGRTHNGGIPVGTLVEIFGPNSAGKTVLLCEIAGAVQRANGNVMFRDPESRLNKQFAQIFDMDTENIDYATATTVPEVFSSVRSWEPQNKDASIHCICADSLAALSTNLEMENEEGDKMGMRRAKEFSEELRKTCRILPENNFLMVCSNQVRENTNAGPYGQKYKSPGGEALGFYASLRLRCNSPQKIREERTVAGKKVRRVTGVETEVEVHKSSVWKPYRTAPIHIVYNYGIDDIRANLQFVKRYTGATTYIIRDEKLGQSVDDAITNVEKANLEDELKEQTIELWNEIEAKFDKKRKPKKR